MPALTQVEVPEDFICPLTHEMMIDPLVSRFGAVYERSAILEWIAHHDNACPLTRKPLRSGDLVSHHALRHRIQLWCQANGVSFRGRSFCSADEDVEIRAEDVLLCARVDLLVGKGSKKESLCRDHKKNPLLSGRRVKGLFSARS